LPVKRKNGPRRRDDTAELEAWESFFAGGHDFFGTAADFAGLTEPLRVEPKGRAEANRAWMAAALAAWGRVGALFLATWEPTPNRAAPWARENFGDPSSRERL
jgi:hypothetical protein